MADYATMKMEEILGRYRSLRPGDWRTAADVWQTMAKDIKDAQAELDKAWENTPVFHLNEPDPEAVAFRAFKENIGFSRISADEWSTLAANVGGRLQSTAEVIEGNRVWVEAAATEWAAAKEEADKEEIRRRAAFFVWNVANKVRDTFNGIPVPSKPYQGPLGSKPKEDTPGGGDPNAQGGGTGPGTGGAPGDLGTGDKPGDTPAAPKTPEAKDPLDQADKFLDVAGKGIDLLGKPADVASKYVGLAQSLKDLLGQGGTGTEGLDTDSLIPDDLYTDQPTLAGGAGTSTAPTFDPSTFTGGGSAGGGLPSTSPVAGLGAVGAAGSLGATGSVGAAPSLAGKGTSASAAGGQQQSTPMYPPMNGMGGAGAAAGGGKADIKPGTAPPRAGGFNVPAEQSESERWRRHGVQADLQGRTNADHRSASAAPALRKRKGPVRAAKPAQQDVLDEELWRL